MEIININRERIKNLTNEELTKFCTFKTADYQLDGAEFLINELARRLETAEDFINNLRGR